MTAAERIKELEAQLKEWETWGVIEIAVRNPNVASYMNHWEGRATQAEAQLAVEQSSKNTAYSERDRLVCAVSKIFPSHLERHPDSDTTWEDDWRWIVFVQFPTGQATWHIHDTELGWFDHLERKNGNTWDGHSTAEKYARIGRFDRIGQLAATGWQPLTADTKWTGEGALAGKWVSRTWWAQEWYPAHLAQDLLDMGYTHYLYVPPPQKGGE